MNKTKTLIASLTLGTLIAAPAMAALVDLTTWTAEGSGTWAVAGDTHSVFQSVNGSPTVFYSDFDGMGKALSGKIRVETTTDDDFIGFVLGFDPGDVTASTTDFILVDWKQATQANGGCTGSLGLAVSHVTGGLPNNSGTWCHNGTTITELARATSLGATGWADNTEYSFDLIFNASNIEVWVNGTKELDVNGSFSDGRFGFYNYSQQSVRYSAIEEDVAPPTGNIPEPSIAALMGLGLLGLVAVRRRK